MSNKVYIGFSIDMDGATENNQVFINGMNNLFKFFEKINALSGVNWLINESSFDTTKLYPNIVKQIYKCVKEKNTLIGLHTHFNVNKFNCPENLILPAIEGYTSGGCFGMSNDKNKWEKEGLIICRNNIEKFIKDNFNDDYKIMAFKSGDHLRTNSMFEALVDNKYNVDCTMRYEAVRKIPFNNNIIIPYDDSKIKFLNGPFIITTKNGKILEIPETRNINSQIEKYIQIINKKKNIYLIFQLHPWQVLDELEGRKDLRNVMLDNIRRIKKYYNDSEIVYANLDVMRENIMKNKEYYTVSL